MKIISYLLFGICISITLNVQAKGIEFFEGTWEEAVAQAVLEEKIIFVDAYAEWCGPCKRMARDVFTDSEVGDFYNAQFINIKMDMEKPKNADFARQYPAQAFPTLYYIDFKGKVVHKVKGARDATGFIELGREALSKNDRSAIYMEAYEAGDRSPQLMYQYVKSLNKAGKPTLKIANDYLLSKPDLSDKNNLLFLLEAMTEMDSRIFDLAMENRRAIEEQSSKKIVEQRIALAAKATLKKALEYKSEDLLEATQQEMKKYHSSEATVFYLESEMHFAQQQQNSKRYYKAWKKYVSEVADPGPVEQSMMASAAVRSFPNDSKGTKLAESIAQKAADQSDAAAVQMVYAEILLANGKKELAKKTASKAVQLAKEQGDQMQMFKAMQLVKGME